MTGTRRQPPDRGIVALEWGLVGLLFLAPLPLGAVIPAGRTALETGCGLLGVIWAVRAWRIETALPRPVVRWALVAWLALAAFQIAPLGRALVDVVSPESVALRDGSVATGAAATAEASILGTDPATLDPVVTVSVAPERTASALRTASAVVALFFVACTVVERRGLRRLCRGLLATAAVQGSYGMVVLLSGHDRILFWEKRHYLDCATGTFVNRNHFAGFVAACAVAGFAGWLADARERAREHPDRGLGARIDAYGARIAIGAGALVASLGGLLLSFSRAGTALAIAGLGLTALAGGNLRRRGASALAIALLAAVPLTVFGGARMVARYAESSGDLWAPGGRFDVWRDATDLLAMFPWTGAGLGSFAEAFPLVRSPQVRLFYDHAHNDVLQAVVECGLAGFAILAILGVALGIRTVRAATGAVGTRATGIAVAVAVVALHATIDFPLHIPAYAALAGALAGALEGAWLRRT